MNGFQSPNYTQTPNDLFDELMPEMGLAELKVVMCIVRNTFGYHKEEVKLSIRAIARFTGLTAKSVMEGATQAEAHGLIERRMEGNKTTIWSAIVSVIPTKTRRDTKYHADVLPTTTLLGVKEKKEKVKKGDLVDGILFFGKQAQERGEDKAEEVIQELERGLKVNITRSLSNQSVAKRLLKDGRPISAWLSWAMADEWRAAHLYLYADLEKVWRDFPQAFDGNINGYNPQGLSIS